jgi:hypothetical protein
MSDSMPSMDQLGTEYTSFSIHFGGEGGYEVRAIAVEDDTVVTVPAFSTSLTLNMGEFHLIDNTVTGLGFKVSCSKPCMAVQYVPSLPAGGDTGEAIGAFLAVLTPDERSSTNLIFTVPSMMNDEPDFMAAISLIVNTIPVTGLYLNDTSLVDLDWQPVEDSPNCFSTVEVGYGFDHLFTTYPSERQVGNKRH